MNNIQRISVLLAVSLLFSLLNCSALYAASWPNVIPNSQAALSDYTHQTSRLLVKYKSAVLTLQSSAQIQSLSRNKSALRNKYGLTKPTQFKSLPDLEVVDIDPKNADQIIGQLSKDPAIEYVERDRLVDFRALPNDSRYPEQWSLNDNPLDADINAEAGWDINSGDKSAVVAVIDSGVAYTHKDLIDNIWRNPGEIPDDGIDNDNNNIVDDVYGYDAGDNDADPYDDVIGHGTHVAGIIAASGNNNLGISGVMWNASVLVCKIYSASRTGISAFLSDAVECLDYVWDLKQNHNINIIASNNSWGWKGIPSKALKDVIEKHRQAGILFVAAAGNDAHDNDSGDDYPSSYQLGNIISVAAHNQFAEQSGFTSYGKHTVHISAPGEAILSSLPIFAPSAEAVAMNNAVYYESFESDLGSFIYSGNWSITNLAFSGATSLSVIVDNSGGTLELISPVIDLSAQSEALTLGVMANINASLSATLDVSSDGQTWQNIGSVNSFIINSWEYFHFAIPMEFNLGSFQYRIVINSASVLPEPMSAWFDDVTIYPSKLHLQPDGFGYASGTSMAAPHVVGALGLLKAQDPTRNWKQLKNLIMAGGKSFDTQNAPTISNRRLRLNDSDGSGSMTCQDQLVQRRIAPRTNKLDVSESNPTVHLEFLNINCDLPAGPVSVTILENGETITLYDDGGNGDRDPEDGVYSADLDVYNLGFDQIHLEFPDADRITAMRRGQYHYDDTVSYTWRDISLPHLLILTETEPFIAAVTPPFPIQFADNSYTTVYVSIFGTVSFQFPRSEDPPLLNRDLPNNSFEAMLAPMWSDYDFTNAEVIWGVNGIAPNRELIVQWTAYPWESGISSTTVSSGVFQLLLFEGNNDVVFNYQDVDFGNASYDNGLLSSTGIQLSSTNGLNYKAGEAAINNNTSIRWTYQAATPVSTPMPAGGNGNGNNGTGSSNEPAKPNVSGGGGSGGSGYCLLLLLGCFYAKRFRITLH